MNHKCIQNELSAYLDNELTANRHEQVEAHLQSCEECSEMLSAFQQNRQRVADLSHPAPSTLKDAVMAEIHTQFQNDLSTYLDNELAPAEHQRIEAHLHACSECTATLSAFRENRERIKRLEHPAPSSIHDAAMAKIRQQTAAADVAESTATKWLPDLGRWFFRPVTAGATGILTLALILGALYFYPNGNFYPNDTQQYEDTLDFYFEVHAEQVDNPLKSNVGRPMRTTSTVESSSAETADDAETFLDLYFDSIGN